MFNTVQDGFLGGYLAAGMTKTGKVATFGGEKLPTVTIYMDGFWDGVQYYNSQHHTHVTVLGWNEQTQSGEFTNSFTNLTMGQTITQQFITEGADIIFPVAGGVGPGRGEGGPGRRQHAGSQKVNMMWVDTDGCVSAAQYCKYFITSVEKGIQPAVKTAVLAAANGTFKGGTYIGTLANGGVALAPYHDFASKVPASPAGRGQQGESRDHQRQDRAGHQEPGVTGSPARPSLDRRFRLGRAAMAAWPSLGHTGGRAGPA